MLCPTISQAGKSMPACYSSSKQCLLFHLYHKRAYQTGPFLPSGWVYNM